MKKSISKKLRLNKRTVANLNDLEMLHLKGGGTTYGRTCGGASYDGASCSCNTRSASPLTTCSYQGCGSC